jgi:hypothetical protein
VIEAVELLKKLKEGGGAAAGGAASGTPEGVAEDEQAIVEELQRAADAGNPEAIQELRRRGQLRENFKTPEDELVWEDEEPQPGPSNHPPRGMSDEEVERRIKERVPVSESLDEDELVIPSQPHPRGFNPVVGEVAREGYDRRKERANRDARRLGRQVPFPDIEAG